MDSGLHPPFWASLVALMRRHIFKFSSRPFPAILGPAQGGHMQATAAPQAARATTINTAVLWHEYMLARSARGGVDLFKIQLLVWCALLKTNICNLAAHN
jgi:hypothetical protein